MSTDRALCKLCKAKVLWLQVGSRRVQVDWPGRNAGSVAAYQSAEGVWFAWYSAPGDAIAAHCRRYQPHTETCTQAPAIPDRSEAQRQPEALSGADWRKAVKQAQSARNAALRRPRPRVQPTAGYRKPAQ